MFNVLNCQTFFALCVTGLFTLNYPNMDTLKNPSTLKIFHKFWETTSRILARLSGLALGVLPMANSSLASKPSRQGILWCPEQLKKKTF